MPIGLVIFAGKSHLDLHGNLSTLPIIFTLSCFYQESRNKDKFWQPLAFLPNLSYGALSTKNSKKPSHQGYQDEYDCLHAAFSSLRCLHCNGGIQSWGDLLLVRYGFTIVLVIVKVTIAGLVTSMEVVISTICIKTVIAECGIWTSPTQIVSISHNKNILPKDSDRGMYK
jgi:hypothetical protein